jgi:hypothetical protein
MKMFIATLLALTLPASAAIAKPAKHSVQAPPIIRVTVPQPDVEQELMEQDLINDDISTPVTLPTGEIQDVVGLVIPIRTPDGHAATITTVPGQFWTNELGNPDSVIQMERARTLLTDHEQLPAATLRRFMDDTAPGTIAGQMFMHNNRRSRKIVSKVYLDTGAPLDSASGRMYLLTTGSFNHAPGSIKTETGTHMTTPYERDFRSPAGRKRLPNFITNRPGIIIRND